MTTIYCPLKDCSCNNAESDADEGICIKDDIIMGMRFWNDVRFVYCPEYDEDY